MARVLVCEPVEETRFLIERVVARMGHEIADGEAAAVDVLFYDPATSAGTAQARSARRLWPGVVVIACSSVPPRSSITGPPPDAVLMHPFAPSDVRRVLNATLLAAVAAR